MVQKSSTRRGRPRAYDPDTALAQAMAAFWDAGYAATSLDDLSAATGMNRPSLYGAFGDKRALYLKTIEGYRAAARAALKKALADDCPLPEALRRVYGAALVLYLTGENGARGCFLIGTAATQAVLDPAVRNVFADGLHEIDAAFASRIRLAQTRGELPADADPAALGRIASAILHTIALRARAGETRAALEATAESGIALICGAPKHGQKTAPG